MLEEKKQEAVETSRRVEPSHASKAFWFTTDMMLLLLLAGSEISYAVFCAENTMDSLENPLKRYAPNVVSQISKGISVSAQAMAYTDAALSVLSVLDVREKREAFFNSFSEGRASLNDGGKIASLLFAVNLSLLSMHYVSGSFSPWVGLRAAGYDHQFSDTAGPIAFAGQLSLYLLLNGKRFFSNPQDAIDIYNLPREKKKQIAKELVSTLKGVKFLLRSFSNMLTRAMIFYGLGQYNQRYLPGFDLLNQHPNVYPWMAAATGPYQILTTQVRNDYAKTYASEEKEAHDVESHAVVVAALPSQSCVTTSVHWASDKMLSVIVFMVFMLRTLSMPALFTGPIDDPESNFGTKELILTFAGLAFGVFTTSQYIKYMKGETKEAIRNTSTNLSSFFCPPRERVTLGPDFLKPLLGPDSTRISLNQK